MKKFIEVHDINVIPSKGVMITGINEDYDSLSKDEILENVGKMIEIFNPNGTRVKGKILEIEFSESLIGRKNFYLLLPLQLNNLVYKGASAFIN